MNKWEYIESSIYKGWLSSSDYDADLLRGRGWNEIYCFVLFYDVYPSAYFYSNTCKLQDR